MRRLLALCSEVEQAPELIGKTRELSDRLKAGVTLVYVKEEGLFELPIYEGREENMEAVREHLEELLRKEGLEEWALLIYENDLVDHAVLESDREDSLLIVANQHEELGKLLQKSDRPLYVIVPEAEHHPVKGLYVPDVVGDPAPCFHMVKRLEPKVGWEAYMDYQFFPSADDAMIDPVMGTMTPEILIQEESQVIESTRERFEAFCKAEGIPGHFEIGESGIEQDVQDALERSGADLLVFAPTDRETILAEGAKGLLANTDVDVLVCFQVRAASLEL
ncbi:hypothetical protein Nitsa_0676 [Nitratifractor salsuginis DSM 16511]|uniref:UspA domain-containing protein n=2 Tax=Nitratifractor salsuginis TaxID=269261 RepID=E6X1T6_NITSE|nr:hypothetical protein Nitsa_0676 [Nitratifractor salsuginis DSM 16511]